VPTLPHTDLRLSSLIKRWRLVRRGWLSGRRRRVRHANPVLNAIEQSVWIKSALQAAFVVVCSLLIFNAGPATPFAAEPVKGSFYGLVLALTAVVMLEASLRDLCRRNSRVVLVLGILVAHLLLVRLAMSAADAGLIPSAYRHFAVPFAFAPMLHGVLLGRGAGAFSAVFVTLLGALLAPSGDVFGFIILSLVGGLTGVLAVHCLRKRVQLLRAGIYVGAVTLLLGALLGLLDIASCFSVDAFAHSKQLATGAAVACSTAVLTALIISGLLPIFEGVFQLSTGITWLELSDLNHRLLRRLQLEAPGTFHHSLVVASLAEAAAETIGADAPMCRVCAYYHDVGKLAKPSYFIENQHEGMENPHDALTPTMSALIIIAHVKEGVDLAMKHKLNPRIIDVIQEHHGDSLVTYFHHRAREQKRLELEKVGRGLGNPEDLPEVDETSFRYPGPRPHTRESGIVALADAVESASRSLRKPTPGRIQALVDEMVRGRILDGQLDRCPLTLDELTAIRESFCNTLRSMLHSRIQYPKEREKSKVISRSVVPDRSASKQQRVIPKP
jgi:putative nucleotidyltransferase with HDIG domain